MTMAGIAIAAAPLVIGAGASVGASYLSKDKGGGGGGGGGGRFAPSGQRTTEREIRQLPDYPESEGARVNWWDTLQDWQGQPGYGAIAPEWEDIWKNASQKVQRFYAGGPEGQGQIGRAKAGLARRGVSEQGAADKVLSQVGFQQGNTLQDMATRQALEKANLSESGRKTWLNSLQSLAGLKPSFMYGDTVTTDFDYQEGESSAGGGFMSSLLNPGGMGMDVLGGILGGGEGEGDTGIGDIIGMFTDGGTDEGDGSGGSIDSETITQLLSLLGGS